MYIYKPKRETKAHIVLPVIFILISIVAMTCSRVSLIPAFITQALAVVSIALAIHVITRYSLTDHTYEADRFFPNLDEDEEWEIVATSEEQTYFDIAYEFVKYRRKK